MGYTIAITVVRQADGSYVGTPSLVDERVGRIERAAGP
jgi:hypothetical protein